MLFDGSGRSGRVEFWLALTVVWAAFELYAALGALVHWITGWVAWPALLVAASSVLSRRLHDRGRSGWWSAFPMAAYLVCRPWPEGVPGGIALGVLLGFGLSLALEPGDRGFNRFGPQPG